MEWHGYTAFQEAQRNYLEHYGKKGMKWRHRKSLLQNVSDQAHRPTQNSGSQNQSNGGTMITNAGQSASNAISSTSAQIHEQLHPTSTYKEAKKSKRFSFFSSILAKIKKLFGK